MKTKSLDVGRLVCIVVIALAMAALALAITAQPSAAFAKDSGSSASASTSSESASKSAASKSASDSSASVSESAADSSDAASSTDAILSELESSADPTSPDSPAFGGLPMMGDDYVFFGRSLQLGQHAVVNDLIAACQNITLTDIKVGGSIRAAAQKIELENTSASENITLAAEKVNVKNSDANAVILAGSKVSVSGTCNELSAFAETVHIDGIVEGDAVVGANSVELGSNAIIKGTLYVEAASEPILQSGAKVNKVEFKQTEKPSPAPAESDSGGMPPILPIIATITNGINTITVTFTEADAAITEAAQTAQTIAELIPIVMTIVSIISTILIAMLAEWLFRRQTAGAADMIRNRTGATIGTGIIGAIAAPIVIIILCCLVITAPIAGALIFALFAMTVVSQGFAGASLARLAFPKLGRYLRALVGGAIVGVASAIPTLGMIVSVAAFMYLLGYVLQSIFLNMRAAKQTAQTESTISQPEPYQAVPAAETAPMASSAEPGSATPTAESVSAAPAAEAAAPEPVAESAVTTAADSSTSPAQEDATNN